VFKPRQYSTKRNEDVLWQFTNLKQPPETGPLKDAFYSLSKVPARPPSAPPLRPCRLSSALRSSKSTRTSSSSRTAASHSWFAARIASPRSVHAADPRRPFPVPALFVGVEQLLPAHVVADLSPPHQERHHGAGVDPGRAPPSGTERPPAPWPGLTLRAPTQAQSSTKVRQLTPEQERHLQRAFQMFDIRKSGTLNMVLLAKAARA
jgi:hypothetical protein